jgi:ribosomal-protein-alanine N-acetyltransferase
MLIFNFKPFPLINTARLDLREITINDAPALFALRSHPDTMKYIGRPPAQSIDEVHDWINILNNIALKNEGVMWAIILKETNALIGTICYWQLNPADHRAEIGYMLHPDHQNKGYMHEALNEVINYGFGVMQLHSIEANVKPDNQPSVKILEKSNFVREAYFKENYYSNGKFLDSAVYSLLTNK